MTDKTDAEKLAEAEAMMAEAAALGGKFSGPTPPFPLAFIMSHFIEGEVEQWVGAEKQILKVGEVAHMPPGVVHATFNLSGKDAMILAILSPGAATGPFLVDVSGEEPWASLRGC